MSDFPSLSQAIGRRMRELRDEHGCTASQLADKAQELGLGWKRSTVASIETGKRGLSAEELVTLPLLLSYTLGAEIHLQDLLVSDGAYVANDLVFTRQGLTSVLTQQEMPSDGFRRPESTRRLLDAMDFGGKASLGKRVERLWPGIPRSGRFIDLGVLQEVERAGSGDAEQKAARKLGLSGVDVAAVSFRLWGHGLTAERDDRAGDNATRRGHVTRTLIEDIRAVLQEVKDG